MAESFAGLITAATRQNAGRFGSGCPPGGVKFPAGTDSAVVIDVSGSATLAIPSQVAARAAVPGRSSNRRETRCIPDYRTSMNGRESRGALLSGSGEDFVIRAGHDHQQTAILRCYRAVN